MRVSSLLIYRGVRIRTPHDMVTVMYDLRWALLYMQRRTVFLILRVMWASDKSLARLHNLSLNRCRLETIPYLNDSWLASMFYNFRVNTAPWLTSLTARHVLGHYNKNRTWRVLIALFYFSVFFVWLIGGNSCFFIFDNQQ